MMVSFIFHGKGNLFMLRGRSIHRRCSVKKKMFLKISQNPQESSGASASFLIKLQALACNFIEKETQEQMFSCEFCEIFKNNFSAEHNPATVSREGRDIC